MKILSSPKLILFSSDLLLPHDASPFNPYDCFSPVDSFHRQWKPRKFARILPLALPRSLANPPRNFPFSPLACFFFSGALETPTTLPLFPRKFRATFFCLKVLFVPDQISPYYPCLNIQWAFSLFSPIFLSLHLFITFRTSVE